MTAQTYTVTYTDGAGGAAFNDKTYSNILHGAPTPAFGGTPERDGYTFNGWKPTVKATVTNDATYTATWTRNSSRDDDDKYSFAIQKVDAQDGHALNGAVFELYQRDSRDNKLPASRKTTSHWGTESGIALFSVSATKTSDGGSTWYYRKSPPRRAAFWTQRNMKFPQGISITMTRARRWPKPKPCGTTAAPRLIC